MTPRAAPMAPDERRQAIVDAVIPLLVTHGASVTTRQIAEAAGVAEGTIFRVFPDKCALMHAAARATFDPERGRRRLSEIDPDLDLRAMVRMVAEEMLASMERVMAVLMAVRGALGPGAEDQPREQRTGPPEFVLEANRALLESLTDLFARYQDELRVPAERAALALRSLVFGSRHPGMDDRAGLTAEEIATVVVSGVAGSGGRD
ncbi:MAG TPA: TetR/AcrR family transcriptional regulator [Nocardioidaceae bacterium]|nr:TetR/AcrR family transcriptional regulator [Nocardioidaceae bacterium]